MQFQRKRLTCLDPNGTLSLEKAAHKCARARARRGALGTNGV